MFGPATGRRASIRFAADCLVRENRIHTEWLVRDAGAQVRQLGFDLQGTARRLAEVGPPEVPVVSPDTRLEGQAPRRALDLPSDTLDGWARHLFHDLWNLKRFDWLDRHYHPDAVVHAGGGRVARGVRNIGALLLHIQVAIPDGMLRVEHVCHSEETDGVVVAVRWVYEGTTQAGGVLGECPVGKPVFMMGISHLRLAGRPGGGGVDGVRRTGRADPGLSRVTARWDDQPGVLSPVGRSFGELMEHGPSRQDLPGFEPVYRDFVDYIIRCTHRIWEEKNVGLCRTHYGPDCVMHTLSGPQVGAEVVVQNTVDALAMSSDRQVIGEDVIWSDEGDGHLHSSHRIHSTSTHLGDDAMLGAATRREAGVMTIADCLCRENRIVEEWLVRDNLRAVWQVGGDPWALAQAQAAADREGDQIRHDWRREEIARVREQRDVEVPDGHPAAVPARMLARALREDLYGEAADALSPAAEIRWPSNRHGFRARLLDRLPDATARLPAPAGADDRPRGGTPAARRRRGDRRALVARRHSHAGAGVWGTPTGRDLLILAVSHHRLRAGAIVEDLTVFDELAVLRQIGGGLGA